MATISISITGDQGTVVSGSGKADNETLALAKQLQQILSDAATAPKN